MPELVVTPCRSTLAFPFRAYRGGNGNTSEAALGGDPAIPSSAAYAAALGEGAEGVGDDLIADAELLAQSRGGERFRGAGDELEDAGDGRVVLLFAIDDVEAGGRVAVIDDELEAERGWRGSGSVLDLQLECVLGELAEVEVGVAEGGEVRAATQASPSIAGGSLAGVVDL